MKEPRRFDLYLHDMIMSMERILSYLQGHTLKSFEENFMVADAVARNFEIIGEAARKIPKEITDKFPHNPWNKMYQLRNIVSHAYFSVDHETLWEISTSQLPGNLEDLKRIFKEEVNKEQH